MFRRAEARHFSPVILLSAQLAPFLPPGGQKSIRTAGDGELFPAAAKGDFFMFPLTADMNCYMIGAK